MAGGQPIYVSVIGPGEAPAEGDLERAEEVGRLLAEAGAILVCGGLGGVMEAASRGARSAGGTVVGILPGESREDGNAFLTVAIPTELSHARNAIVVRSGDAVIAVGGEYGTLSEIGLALKMGTPVIGLGTWELARGGTRCDAIEVASDPADAVSRALARAARSV